MTTVGVVGAHHAPPRNQWRPVLDLDDYWTSSSHRGVPSMHGSTKHAWEYQACMGEEGEPPLLS